MTQTNHQEKKPCDFVFPTNKMRKADCDYETLLTSTSTSSANHFLYDEDEENNNGDEWLGQTSTLSIKKKRIHT